MLRGGAEQAHFKEKSDREGLRLFTLYLKHIYFKAEKRLKGGFKTMTSLKVNLDELPATLVELLNPWSVGLKAMTNLILGVPCGGGKHEVTVTLTRQGKVEIFSPCQLLPEPARKLAGSDCLVRVSEELIKALINALRDEVVCKRVVEVLAHIGAPAVKPLIEGLRDERVRRGAVEALGRIGKPAVKPLIEALKDERVREEAVEALVRIGEPAVVLLRQVLRQTSREDPLRWVIIQILRQIPERGERRWR